MAGHDVFISYSTLDKVSADAVCHGLEAEGVRCWMAPRDVTPGMDWQQSLLDAIGAAKAVVLVFTQNANNSANVKKEITAAFEGGAVVIPFRLEEVEPQGSLRYHLTGVHWLDAMTPPLDANVRGLAGNLKRLLASLKSAEEPEAKPLGLLEDAEPEPPPRPTPPPPRPTPPPTPAPPKPVPPRPVPPRPPTQSAGKPNWPLIIGAGLAALVVVSLLAIALRGKSDPAPTPLIGQNSAVGGNTPALNTGPTPPVVVANPPPPPAASTPAREEALANLRTPIENMQEYAGEFGQTPGGPPLSIPGASVVATQQLGFAIVNGVTEVTLIDALGCRDHASLPTAQCLEPSADVAQALRRGGFDQDRPLVFFCSGPSCPNSFNMARAAAAAGYRNVFWYRGGTEAWTSAGLPTMAATPMPS